MVTQPDAEKDKEAKSDCSINQRAEDGSDRNSVCTNLLSKEEVTEEEFDFQARRPNTNSFGSTQSGLNRTVYRKEKGSLLTPNEIEASNKGIDTADLGDLETESINQIHQAYQLAANAGLESFYPQP